MKSGTIEQEIIQLIEKEPKGYLIITNFKTKISESLRTKIGITKNSNQQIVIDAIKKACQQFYFYKKKNTHSISIYAPAELCIRFINENPNRTIKQIAIKTPFKNEEFALLLNVLSAEGKINIDLEFINSEWVIKFKPISSEKTTSDDKSTAIKQDIHFRELKRAYKNLERGRGYVEIYEIRDYLKWERKQFDDILETLWNKKIIDLQNSNQDSLTQQQRDDSFLDRGNTLRIIMLWGEA